MMITPRFLASVAFVMVDLTDKEMNDNLKYLEEQYPRFLSLWLKNGIFKELE